jgi:superfamily I DNA and/or RNA helicase
MCLQLYNFSKRHAFGVDCVFIDEAGQLTLGSAALALRSLKSTGCVVVSGDSEQLPPILTAQYPQLARPLFGSILDCLMAKREDFDLLSSPSEFSATQSTIVQLTGEVIFTLHVD